MKDSVTWKIGGEAGFGIMSSGTMLSKTFGRQGYFTLATNEYPSLIRGGHNIITVRIAAKPFHSLNKDIHILAALNKETVVLHKDEITSGGIIVYDPQDYEWKSSDFSQAITLLPITLKEMVRQKSADPVMRNTILLGATVALMGGEFAWLQQVITDQFIKKGQNVVDFNLDLARVGFDHVQNSTDNLKEHQLQPVQKQENHLIINASEAVALGAIRGGMKFAAIYPMTPINSVISFFADHSEELGIVYKQPEDEIAGMNMALGASYAGVRSMVATSGGGFALMVEGLSLAGMMELPVVIDLGMRPGPATGMPTWTEQGELLFAISAGHGEFARIILAPGNCDDSYQLTAQAFNLADKYQVPVFVLTDKYLNESQWSVNESVFTAPFTIDRGKLVKPEELTPGQSFKRFRLDVPDGISPRVFPGTKGGQFFSNSYEHDEFGHVTESPEGRVLMAEKRLKKAEAIARDIWAPVIHGDDTKETIVVTWGSTTGPLLEALELARAKGKKVRVIQYKWLYPFPAEETKKLLAGAKRIIDIEQNGTGQLAQLIRASTGIDIQEKILKNDGRPFYPEEIIERAKL